MRKCFKYIFVFLLTFICFNKFIIAMDFDKNKTIKYGTTEIKMSDVAELRAEADYYKTIDKVCIYDSVDSKVQYHSNGPFLNEHNELIYLFIYEDGSTSTGWTNTYSSCKRNAKVPTRSTNPKAAGYSTTTFNCVDGFQEDNASIRRGMINWSKSTDNASGYKSEFADAYEAYQTHKSCPSYMARAENGNSHYFFLSYNEDSGDIDKIKKYAENQSGNKVVEYYNILEPNNLKDKISCDYSASKDDENKVLTLNFDKNSNTTLENGYGTSFEKDGNMQNIGSVYLRSRIYSASYYGQISDNKCPKTLQSCYTWGNVEVYGDASLHSDKFCDESANLTLYCVGNKCSDKNICQYYADKYKNLRTYLDNYMSEDNQNEKKKIMNDYNTTKDQLNAFCLSVLQKMNYEEGSCVDSCINSNKELYKMEVDVGFRNPKVQDKCNIGDDILSMVYNVLKWAKYILPAIVIILTMLDFIKAIAAQNDDDMKKAQGKFVKRLIVAALLFLLPLIINFVLQTFGFYDKNCDITALFKK